MFLSHISSDNQVKNISFSTFHHLSLSSIILYVFTFKKIILFLQYSGEIYKITTNALGNKLGYGYIETVYKPLEQSTT